MNNDIIADMFTKIRNALKENHHTVTITHSKIKYTICQILLNCGYITHFEVADTSLVKKHIKLTLKYNKNGSPIISCINKVSKSSKRIYVAKQEIPKVLNGFGISILSTSKGVLSGKEARLKNVGGELIGEIW
jgi:small subunit ribosomal protein S8